MPLADRTRSLFTGAPSLPRVSMPSYPTALTRKSRLGAADPTVNVDAPPSEPPLVPDARAVPSGDAELSATKRAVGSNGGAAVGRRADLEGGGDGTDGPGDENENASARGTARGTNRGADRSMDDGASSIGTPSVPVPSTSSMNGAPSDDDDDDDDDDATLAAVRTSLDASELAAVGESLDALEAIPTLTLEDFLHPGFMAGGSDSGMSAPSSRCDTPRGGGDEDRTAAAAASHYDADTDLEVPEEVDPRVSGALDELNDAMTRVNELEAAYNAARRSRTAVRRDSAMRVAEVERRLSASVRAAVPFFHRQAMANLYQVRSIEALRTYERAHDMHGAAKGAFSRVEKQMAARAEAKRRAGTGLGSPQQPSGGRGASDDGGGSTSFDADLMIACSDAISKVVETENMKKRAEVAHAENTRLATQAVTEAFRLKKKFGKHVEKARPYFTAKSQAEGECAAADEAVNEARARVDEGKARYQRALEELSRISEEVHQRRQREKREREMAAAEAAEAEAAAGKAYSETASPADSNEGGGQDSELAEAAAVDGQDVGRAAVDGTELAAETSTALPQTRNHDLGAAAPTSSKDEVNEVAAAREETDGDGEAVGQADAREKTPEMATGEGVDVAIEKEEEEEVEDDGKELVLATDGDIGTIDETSSDVVDAAADTDDDLC